MWTVYEMAAPALPDGCDVAASFLTRCRGSQYFGQCRCGDFGLVSRHKPAEHRFLMFPLFPTLLCSAFGLFQQRYMNCVSLRSRTSALYFERRFPDSSFGLFQQQIQEVRQSPEPNVTHCTWMVQQRIHCHCHEAEVSCTLALTPSQSFCVSGVSQQNPCLRRVCFP